MVGAAKKISSVVVLIILIEVLYLDVDGTSWRAGASTCFSFGFPFRSVSFGAATGEMGPVPEDEWAAGLEADPILLVIDVSVALLLGLVLVQCVPTTALVLLVKGCVLGSVTGGALSLLAEMAPESLVSWAVVIVVMFALVPLTIYIISLGCKRQTTIIMVLSALTVFTFWRSLFLVEGLYDGFMEDDVLLDLPMVLRLVAVLLVPVCECMVIMLLHKKVFPKSWQKRRSNYTQTGTGQQGDESADNSDRTGRGRRVRKAALYTVLLAIAFYVGFHFSILREMRNDPFCVSEAIWSELERQEISLDSWHSENWPDSPEIGWNASFAVEICADDANKYHAWISKHILIPWIEVTIEQIETVGQVGESQSPGEE